MTMFNFHNMRGPRATFGMLPTSWALPAAHYGDPDARVIRHHLFVRPSRAGVWRLDELVVTGLDRQGILIESVRTWCAPVAEQSNPLGVALSFADALRTEAPTVSPDVLGGVLGKDGEWPMAGLRLTITPERLLVVTVMHEQMCSVPTPRVAVVCTAIEQEE